MNPAAAFRLPAVSDSGPKGKVLFLSIRLLRSFRGLAHSGAPYPG